MKSRIHLCLFILILCFSDTVAQIATEHYIPPIFGTMGSINQFKIVITTLSEEPFEVNISNGDGTYKQTIQVSLTNPQEVTPELNGVKLGFPYVVHRDIYPQTNLDAVLNQVLPQHGLILVGEKPFFANLMTAIPAQAEILTSKGIAGKGKSFFTGHQHMSWLNSGTNSLKSHFTSVMAIEDGTQVEFYNPRSLFHGQPNHRFRVNLNAGESYIVGNTVLALSYQCGTTYECMNDYNGTQITSNKEITVNSGSAHGGYALSDTDESRDIGFDQITPIESAGREYILVEGNGGANNAKNEVAIVVATKDNTTLHVNGKMDADNTFNMTEAGDYIVIPWEKYINNNMFIQADKEVFVYQTLAGSSSPVSPGMMFIPRLTLDATKEVYISGVSSLGAPSLYLVAQKDSETRINGVLIDSKTAHSVEGNDDWVTYRIQDMTPYGGNEADFHVISTGVLNVAVTSLVGVAGAGGYYSGFSKDISNSGVGKLGRKNFHLRCLKEVNLVSQGAVSYQWSADNPAHMNYLVNKDDSTKTFVPDPQMKDGIYKYKVIMEVKTLLGRRVDTTILTINLQQFEHMFEKSYRTCSSDQVTLNPDINPELDEYFTWMAHPQLSETNKASPQFYGSAELLEKSVQLNLNFDDGYCQISENIDVKIYDCDRPKIQQSWIYDRDSNGIGETIIIQFDKAIADFGSITSIDWSSEGANNYRADAEKATYDTLNNGQPDSTRVILDMTDRFQFGTRANPTMTPYINYYLDSAVLEDKIGPVVQEAKKVYPSERQYAIRQKDGSLIFHENIINIEVKVSEPIRVSDNGLMEIFTFSDSRGQPVELIQAKQPALSEDSLTWTLSISSKSKNEVPIVKRVAFPANAAIYDDQGNSSIDLDVAVRDDGNDPFNVMYSEFRTTIIGAMKPNTVNYATENINVFDLDGNWVDSLQQESLLQPQWVAPYNYKNGQLELNASCEDLQGLSDFQFECFASLAIATYTIKGAYEVDVFVYDHLGHFVDQWQQRFGYCGEFDNPDRIQLSGRSELMINDLIWDMKDNNHRKIAAGVYIWKIYIRFESGEKRMMVKKMGLMRSYSQCQEATGTHKSSLFIEFK